MDQDSTWIVLVLSACCIYFNVECLFNENLDLLLKCITYVLVLSFLGVLGHLPIVTLMSFHFVDMLLLWLQGSYVIKIKGPEGWTCAPEQVEFLGYFLAICFSVSH